MRFLRRYKKRLERKFSPQIGRRGFNFQCDVGLRVLLEVMARRLECPIYVLAEHLLEVGLLEVVALLEDEALMERLQRHLVRHHLLVTDLGDAPPHVSKRARRIESALRLLGIYERRGVPIERIKEALDQLEAEARAERAMQRR